MPQPEPSPRTQLKLKAAIGDALVLYSDADQRVELTLDQTRDRDASGGASGGGGVGVRLILRDAAGNGIDAWLACGDRIHLDGYFDARVTVEIDRLTASGARLFFHAPRTVRINRIKLAHQADEQAAAESEPPEASEVAA